MFVAFTPDKDEFERVQKFRINTHLQEQRLGIISLDEGQKRRTISMGVLQPQVAQTQQHLPVCFVP
jgi:hypothetical protein